MLSASWRGVGVALTLGTGTLSVRTAKPECRCWRLVMRQCHGHCNRVRRWLDLEHQWASVRRRRTGSVTWARNRHGEHRGWRNIEGVGGRDACARNRIFRNLEHRCSAWKSSGNSRHARLTDRNLRRRYRSDQLQPHSNRLCVRASDLRSRGCQSTRWHNRSDRGEYLYGRNDDYGRRVGGRRLAGRYIRHGHERRHAEAVSVRSPGR